MTSRAESASAGAYPKGSIDAARFKSPVVRYGCLVCPKNAGSPTYRPLNYELGKRAVAQLEKDSDAFDAALRLSVEEGLGQRKIPFKFLDKIEGKTLRPPRRAPMLGVVFDFSDIPFEMGGVQVIARACVTVCVQGDVLTRAKNAKQTFSYSKFWIRFLYVRKLSGDGPNDLVSLGELREFDMRCQLIGARLVQNMRAPYENVLNVITDTKIELDIGPNFLAIATVAETSDFEDLYAAISEGEELPPDATGNALAAQLADLGISYFRASPEEKGGLLSGKLDKRVSFFAYEGSDYYRGLFFKRTKGELATFVGIGRSPAGADKIRDVQSNPSQNAANVVTASVISEYASRF